MKKKLLMLTSLAFVATLSFAQQVAVKWGQAVPFKVDENEFSFLGGDDKSMYVFKLNTDKSSKSSVPYIDVYDRTSMKLSFSKKLVIPNMDGTVSFAGITTVHSHIIMFVSRKSWNQETLLAFEITKEGVLNTKYKEVLEMDVTEKDRENQFDYELTPDSSHVAVIGKYFIKPPKFSRRWGHDDHEISYYKVNVLDENLTSTWNDKLEMESNPMPFFGERYYAIDNQLNFHIIGKSGKDFKADEKYFFYDYKEHKLNRYVIPKKEEMKGLYGNQGRFIPDTDGSLIFVNPYGKKYDEYNHDQTNGTALLKLKEGKVEIKLLPYPVKMLEGFMMESKAAKKNPSITFLRLYTTHITDDGGRIMIYENSWVQQGQSTIYQTKNTAIVKYDKDWKYEWNAVIGKYQSSYPRYLPYHHAAFIFNGDKIHVLFNDHKKSVTTNDLFDARAITCPGDATGVMVTISDGGQIKKDRLFLGNDEIDTVIIPHKCYQLNNNEMFLFAVRKEKPTFGKLTIK